MKTLRPLGIALAIAAVLSALLPAFNTLFLKPAVLRILIQATERDTLRIGQHLALIAFPEHEGKLQKRLEYGDLVREMHKLSQLYGLQGVKLYTPAGEIYFSTASEEINRSITSSFFFDQVTNGKPYSVFKTRTLRYDPTSPERIELVQTFVPVMSAGSIIGALEIDYDITTRKQHLDTLLDRTSIFLFGASCLVLTLLLVLAARYRISEIRRQATEIKLHHANRRLFDVIEFLPDATFVIDRDGKVVAWNRAMETMTGVSKHQILGRGDHEYALPFYGKRQPMLIDMVGRSEEDLTSTYAAIRRYGDTLVYESPITLLKGEKKTYLWGTASPLLDSQGNRVGAIESIRDITERRMAQEEASMKHALLENILEQIPHAVYWKGTDGCYQGSNRHYARFFGLESGSEIVGRDDSELPWNDEDCAFHLRGEERIIRGEKTSLTSDRTFGLPDGSVRSLLCSKVPLLDSEQQISGVLGIFTDITDRKKFDEEMRQRQRMEAIGTLAGGIAHDFNNILTAVIGYTEAAKYADEHDSATINAHLDRVLQAANRARHLVDQILTFGRQVEGKRHMIRLGAVISEALTLLRATSSPQIEFDIDLKEINDTLLADDTQMHQIVMNLATNACHAMETAGGTLSIRLDSISFLHEHAIGDVLLDPGPYLCLSVADTGQGMAPQTLGRIFEPYFTTKESGRGSGLGLSVVHGIVTGHGGAIEVESSPGQGTHFRIFLPRGVESDGEATIARVPSAQTEHILFVDDEEPLVSLWQQTLEEHGYRVTASTCPEKALQLFIAAPEDFDLVITDMTMPRLNGLDLIKAIRTKCSTTPIILCTAFRNSMTGESARALGANEFMLKPFDRQQFVSTVQQTLSA